MKRLPRLFPSSRSRCAGGWEGLCARLCSVRRSGTVSSSRAAEQNVTLNVRVSPLNTPLCSAQASSSSLPASLISLPHQALNNPCLTEEHKRCRESLQSSGDSCDKPARHQLGLPHRRTGQARLGGYLLNQAPR